jgi:hypothetical protein
MARGIVPPRVTVEAPAPRVVAHASVGVGGELVRGGDFSCEAETCCARRKLVKGDPSCGDLVGDAANWSEA